MLEVVLWRRPRALEIPSAPAASLGSTNVFIYLAFKSCT